MPSLHLFGGVGKAHEPVAVQAFRPEPAIERFDEGVVRRFSRSREVERDTAPIGPEVHDARDELAALVDSCTKSIAQTSFRPTASARSSRSFAITRCFRLDAVKRCKMMKEILEAAVLFFNTKDQ